MATRIPLSQAEENRRLQAERLEMSTAEIGLTVRTTNCLEEKGIFTVRDLLNSTPEDLLSISNFGEKTLEEAVAEIIDASGVLEGRVPWHPHRDRITEPQRAAS